MEVGGQVKIVLYPHPDLDLSIIVPTALLDANTTQIGRVPYLTYAAHTIMGVLGHLSEMSTGPPVPNLYELQDSTLFFVPHDYVYSIVDRFGSIPNGSQQNPTPTNERDPNFVRALGQRDGGCIASGGDSVGCHLVPLAAGSDYITKLSATRPSYHSEEPLTDINDIRNGILLDTHGYHYLGKLLFLLRTPNQYLTAAHIQRRFSDPLRIDKLQTVQFTFHWLKPPDPRPTSLTEPRRRTAADEIPNGTIAYFYGEVTNDNCPASAVLDFTFGSGFLGLFGTPAMKKFASDSAEDEYGTIAQEAKERERLRREQMEKGTKERAERATRRRAETEAEESSDDFDEELAELQDKLAALERLKKDPGMLMMWAISRLPGVVAARQKQEAQIKAIQELSFTRKVEQKRPEIEAWAQSIS
ncbi:hypothetical protein B0H10DRAFT_1985132 [Mycena sp. CBHHK59/15]|nr:hypothetical protein B0H10DRAFT_1985132 [Mycena sp. CBHHK59/15]